MTAPLTAANHLTLQPILFFAFQRGAFDSQSRESALDGSSQSLSLNLFTEYGFGDSFAGGIQLSLFHNRRAIRGEEASTTALGDGLLFARYALPIPRKEAVPELSLLAQIKLPMGKADGMDARKLGTDAMGNGSWEGTVGVNLTEYLRPVVINADLFFNLPFQTQLGGVRNRSGPAFLWTASFEFPLALPVWPHRWGVMAELNGRFQGDTSVAGRVVPDTQVRELTVGAGLEVIFSDEVQLLIGYQRTLWGTNIPAVDVLGLTLVPHAVAPTRGIGPSFAGRFSPLNPA